MDPSIDFPSWSLILTTKFEAGSDYYLLLPKCCELIQQILNNSVLSPPLQERTSEFLNNIIPSVADSIMKLQHISGEELQNCRDFLHLLLNLGEWGIISKVPKLCPILMTILQPNALFYKQNPNELKPIAQAFEETIEVVASVFTDNFSLMFSCFDAIYTPLSQLFSQSLISSAVLSKIVDMSLQPLVRFVTTIDFKTVSSEQLERTFSSLFSFFKS